VVFVALRQTARIQRADRFSAVVAVREFVAPLILAARISTTTAQRAAVELVTSLPDPKNA
jgi:hypothetical protein